MATHISKRRTQFQYFDQLLEGLAWNRSTILDFGGNVGGFLVGAGDEVDHSRYWCLDVTGSAIEIGRRDFPRAHFVHYNRYSAYFNPNGIRHLPIPDLGVKFDIVLAFSVFTHTHQKEMFELIGQLRRTLSPRGILAFTFSDPWYDSSLTGDRPASRRARESARPGARSSFPMEPVRDARRSPRWGIEVDGLLHVEPADRLCQQEAWCQKEVSYCSYFAADYMASLFPGAIVCPPVSPERQHCCILKARRNSRMSAT